MGYVCLCTVHGKEKKAKPKTKKRKTTLNRIQTRRCGRNSRKAVCQIRRYPRRLKPFMIENTNTKMDKLAIARRKIG